MLTAKLIKEKHKEFIRLNNNDKITFKRYILSIKYRK